MSVTYLLLTQVGWCGRSGRGCALALCTTSLVHVMLLTFWHCWSGKLVDVGVLFSWMCFLYVLLFHSPQSILSLWVNSSMSRWMTRNTETLLMAASSGIPKRQPIVGSIPPLAKRWSQNRSCHDKLEDCGDFCRTYCGDIGSTCRHGPGNVALMVWDAEVQMAVGSEGCNGAAPLVPHDTVSRGSVWWLTVPCLVEKLLPADCWYFHT